MGLFRHALLAAMVVSCSSAPPTERQFQGAAVDFVPKSAWNWPMFAAPDGWLIGGSGYTTGLCSPWPMVPAVGLGLVLVPSRQIGSWLGWPGEIPTLLPPWVPNITPDGQIILPLYIKDRQRRIAAYIRNSGFIDLLPELNPPGWNMLPFPPELGLPDVSRLGEAAPVAP
jgi:hypothetical protein